jgi:hypothetical protein
MRRSKGGERDRDRVLVKIEEDNFSWAKFEFYKDNLLWMERVSNM